MGIMGLFRFALSCIDLLAWPAIALGYPLFASIRAVENGSKYHMKKLVIYWTLFSLFSLFEFAFVRIIEWIPFWSCVRFVVIFWLVMPRFDGSIRAYHGLVRPILVIKLQEVIDLLHKLEERICKRETFLDLVEKYIKENGPEAMEKLIELEHENRKRIKSQIETDSEEKTAAATSKQLNETQAARGDTEATEKNAAATKTHQVPYARSTSSVNRTPPEASAYNGRPKSPSLMETQQEFTCDLCKVTAMSEIILNAHLQGIKHKSNVESLKASMLFAKDTRPSPLYENQKCIKTQRETELQGKSAAAASKQVPYAQSNSSVNRTDAITNVKETTQPEASANNWRPKTPSLVEPQQEWTCDLCKVTFMSEIILNAHRQGRKHKSKLEAPEASLLGAEDTGSSPLVQHKQSVPATEVKELMPQKETAEERCREMPPVKKAQQEWTCDLCKVTTTSKITLNGHLHGSKHKSKLEALEASKLGATFAGSGNRHAETPTLKQAQQEWTCGLCKVRATSEETLNGHFNGNKHRAKLQSLVNEDGEGIVKKVEISKYWCTVCNVKLLSDVDLASHLIGKRHSSNIEALIS